MLSREEIEEMLGKAQQLLKEQAWDETREYIEKIREQHDLGHYEKDFLLMEAACWRRRGDEKQQKSRRIYHQLVDQFDPEDLRLADVSEGLAESLIVTGHANEAKTWADKAAAIIAKHDDAPVDLVFRVRNQVAHTTSYTNLNESMRLYEELIEEARAQQQSTSAISNLYFQYGNVRFRNGDYEEAIALIKTSLKLAVESDALKTIADCKRKLALAQILAGNVDEVLNCLVDLDYAREIYAALGDRGEAYSFTEQGELLKFLGRYEEAQAAYKQSLWKARDLDDNIRIAHSLLGLFELDRVLGADLQATPQIAQIEEAMERYRWQRYQWGTVHCLIRVALTEETIGARDEKLDDALHVIEGSTTADFHRERELIQQLKSVDLATSQAEKPLLNWS